MKHSNAENSKANEEVSIGMVSPSVYEKLIPHYELELEKFYRGIHW